MASKKYLDKGGLEHTWNKIKTYLTSNYAKINVRLIEKRVVTTIRFQGHRTYFHIAP